MWWVMLAVPPPGRRLSQRYAGLVLYGASDALLLLAGLGVDPWYVLHQGLSRRAGLGVGTWSIIVGALVLALWVPLRQRPGLGTVSNVTVIGRVVDAAVLLNGIATGAYIGAGLGPGPLSHIFVPRLAIRSRISQ